jgi:hypothetical protein
MGITARLALASIVLAVVFTYALNPIPKQHQEEAISQGQDYLKSQAQEAGLQGSLVSWGSAQLAEMTISVQNYTTYALFSTAEIFVAGVHRGESFGCAGKVWILWSEIPKENP